jgi:hypothetical protein
MNIWRTITFETGTTNYWKIGKRAFWIKKIENGWKLATRMDKDAVELPVKMESQDKPGDLEWITIYSGKRNKIQLIPQLPEKPLLLKPEQEFTIFPGQVLKLFITTPVWVGIKSYDDGKFLKEFPTKELSHTWFGDVDTGELAYSSDSIIREKLSELTIPYDRIVCPIKIKNTAELPLDFVRFIINTPHLKMFRWKDHLIADMVTVEYKGQDQVSRVTYSVDRSIDPEMELLAEAREIHKKRLFKKSFSFIKSIYQT